jgi:hypothetical protein
MVLARQPRSASYGKTAVTGLALLFATLIGWGFADEPAKPKDKEQEKAAHLERMLRLAQSIKISEVAGDQRTEAKLLERAVLAYRDDTRQQQDSTMWIFGQAGPSEKPAALVGRPSAIVAVEFYPERRKATDWLYEIASLSTGTIAAERAPELTWQAKQPGIELKDLEGAPAPSEKPTVRLAQMRQLRDRFSAHEREGTDGRLELKALSTPLYRYQDPGQGLIDGAVFAFANGTNPEVLWLIEAHGKPGMAKTWKFGLAQMTGAGVYVALDDKQIWTRREADPPAVRESYVNGWMKND